jgi:hypothetical protein
MKTIAALLASIAISLVAGKVTAETVTATAAGTYSSTVANGSVGNNFVTGNAGGATRRGYLVFSIAAGQQITAATLSVNASSVIAGPNTLNLYDVTTSTSTLSDGTASPAMAYADLGSGALYGTVQATTNNQTLSITLSAQAVADINAAQGGTFAIGFDNATNESPTDTVFGSSGGSAPRDLILTRGTPPAAIPTLSEWAIIALAAAFGVVGLVWAGRRTRLRTGAELIEG